VGANLFTHGTGQHADQFVDRTICQRLGQ
jgi:hypothetical protein